jgi:hypothetical protein
MKTTKHHRNIRLPGREVQTVLALEQETCACRLPEARRRQGIRLLVELLLAVDRESSGKGGAGERR